MSVTKTAIKQTLTAENREGNQINITALESLTNNDRHSQACACRNTGVHHVGLYAKDPSASAQFYQLLSGDAIAQEIQLSIQYAPNPVFHSGTPETAPAEVLHAFNKSYSTIAASREAEARQFAAILGVAV